MSQPDPSLAANWITGELFSLINASGQSIDEIRVFPAGLAALLQEIQKGRINNATAKSVLAQMAAKGSDPRTIIKESGLEQISDRETIAGVVESVLKAHPAQAAAYRGGKTTLLGWFFGQVMQQTGGKANPDVVRKVLDEKL